jgi:hypothetical protein
MLFVVQTAGWDSNASACVRLVSVFGRTGRANTNTTAQCGDSRPRLSSGAQAPQSSGELTLARTAEGGRAHMPALTSSEREVHLYLRLNFDRFAIQQIGLVLPLLYGLDRSRGEHRVPADQLQVLDITCLADLRL